jgi:fumarate hydratase subunit alpha
MFMAKKALLAPIKKRLAVSGERLENDLLREINELNIGPMGLGGKTTCLGVNILTYPTHIAGLPVAVNISCHALRSASVTL